MKKTFFVVAAISMIIGAAAATEACPNWDCQYPVNYYGCGCSCNSSYGTTAYADWICPTCGNTYDECLCGNGSYTNYNYDYDYDYNDAGYVEEESYDSYSSGIYNTNYVTSTVNSTSMGHWANVRDCSGNIIGQVNCGDNIQIIGMDSNNSDRVIIYDCNTGIQGSVLIDCVCGTYQWDGTGDNGIYNSYIGNSSGSNYYSICGGMSSSAYSAMACSYAPANNYCCMN